MNTLYKNTQYSVLIIALLVPVIIFLSYAYYFQIGAKPLPLFVFVILLIVLLLALISFYKLTIVVDKTTITARFGIGLLQKTVIIDSINLDTLEKVKFSALTGIGLRLTSKGWLWNVKVGNAIFFKAKKGKAFLVGTDDYDCISKILIKQHNGF